MPHDAGGESEEVAAVLGVRIGRIRQLQVRLVDQLGRIQGAVRRSAQTMTRHLAHPVVHQRYELIQSLRIAVPPAMQQLCYLRRRHGRFYGKDPGCGEYTSLTAPHEAIAATVSGFDGDIVKVPRPSTSN